MKNDFAFMLHLIDQYDPALLQALRRLPVRGEQEQAMAAEPQQRVDSGKLWQQLTKNTEDKLELHLFMLSIIPNMAFDLGKLEVLKLELIPDVTIPPSIAQLTGLPEL